jgi:hypothetical protein
VYEWTCGMLGECVSLRRLGVGISAETKEGMEDWPLKGLDALRGMGLKGLDIRVGEIWLAWPHPVHGMLDLKVCGRCCLWFNLGQMKTQDILSQRL